MKINEETLKRGDRVAVALSGGEDSMALLHYLKANAERLGITLSAVNVEHGIRGIPSLIDTAFVKDYCEKEKIPCEFFAVNALEYSKEYGIGTEESARILRYECFVKFIESGKVDKIAVAHHLSDNAETILLNLLRGSSPSGTAGMKNSGDYIVRPMLSVKKEEILSYVKANKIPFVTDETNLIADNKRNFLRLNVIPEIKKIFPAFESGLQRFADLCREDEECLQKLAQDLITEENDGVGIRIEKTKAIFNRAVVKAFVTLGLKKDYTKKNVDAVYALTDAENGKGAELPKNLKAVKEYDKIIIYKEEKPEQKEIPFALGEFKVGGGILKISRSYERKPDYQSGLYFDLEKIPENAVIRFRREGDTFNRFGGKKKKLGDYLTDKKVPLRLRDALPVIASGNEVLILGQIEISDDIKVDKTTEIVVKLNYEKP